MKIGRIVFGIVGLAIVLAVEAATTTGTRALRGSESNGESSSTKTIRGKELSTVFSDTRNHDIVLERFLKASSNKSSKMPKGAGVSKRENFDSTSKDASDLYPEDFFNTEGRASVPKKIDTLSTKSPKNISLGKSSKSYKKQRDKKPKKEDKRSKHKLVK